MAVVVAMVAVASGVVAVAEDRRNAGRKEEGRKEGRKKKLKELKEGKKKS